MKTTVLFACGGKTAKLAILVLGGDDPVESWVSANSRVGRINKDDFEVLVGGVLSHPV